MKGFVWFVRVFFVLKEVGRYLSILIRYMIDLLLCFIKFFGCVVVDLLEGSNIWGEDFFEVRFVIV